MAWVIDFETDTTSPDSTWIWAWGACNLDDPDIFKYGSTIESFIEFTKTCKKLYTHNLKFDGPFIVWYLLNNGYQFTDNKGILPGEFKCLISRQNKWYTLEWCTFDGHKVTLWDSLKKLPFSVKRIAKAFNLEESKLKIDYGEYRAPGHELTPDEVEYLKADCVIVAKALKIQIDQGLDKMTIGSDALNWFKKNMGKRFRYYFPVLDDDVDTYIRRSMRGGYTYLKLPGYEGPTTVYDNNSMYPYCMTLPLPCGSPIAYIGEYQTNSKYPLYVQRLTADFTLKPGYLPTVQYKHGMRGVALDYIIDSKAKVELYMTSVDLELFKKHYDIHDITYLDGYMFKQCQGIFDEYINYWMDIKANNTGALRELAKLMLNNLYGKFAKNPDVTGRMPVIEDNKIRLVLKDNELSETVYIPAGSYITAWGRYTTITAAQHNYDRYIYGDTDSIHLIGPDKPKSIMVHGSRLGAWKHEYNSFWSRYIRSKRYLSLVSQNSKGTKFYKHGQRYYRYKYIVKCAGMPDQCKRVVTKQTFTVSNVFSGKLTAKQVTGGVKLVETTFTLD